MATKEPYSSRWRFSTSEYAAPRSTLGGPVKRTVLVALVLVAMATLVGCGDDEEALSKEEFLRQGNAVCAEGNEELDALFEEQFADLEEGEEPDPAQFAAFIEDDVVPRVQEQIDDIADLEPPEELADDVEQLVTKAQAALDELEQQAKDDPEALLQQEEDPFAEVNEDAAEIGLTVCAEAGEDEE
jgi:hypothetical protein